MATAYLFNMPYHGHVNPTLALIRELSKRGERIVFYGAGKFRAAAEAAGAIFRPFEHEETEKSVSQATMAEWQMRTAEQTLEQLVGDARIDKPAYVMTDYLCVWGRFFAQHLALPTVVIHTTFPFTAAAPEIAYRSIRDIWRTPHAVRKVSSFLMADWRISRRWRVPRIGIPFRLVLGDFGDLHLVLCIREQAPAGQRLDDRYFFVGPCVRGAGVTQGEALPKLDSRPLLYVSLGTFWRHPQALYRACIDAFADSGIQVLISGKELIEPASIASLPDNFHVRTHVDQIDVLSRSSAFITHGGMNSVCEALLAGVPMLVYPQGFDQFAQAGFVEASGTGLVLNAAKVSPGNLRVMVGRLIEEQDFRIRCQKMGCKLREAPGVARASELILSLREKPLATKHRVHIRPAAASS